MDNSSNVCTKGQVEKILSVLKTCVKEDRYKIALNMNRKENMRFIQEYNLTDKKQKEILLKVGVNDFCGSVYNRKNGFGHEVLYVFSPRITLWNMDGFEESVNIYIKLNITLYSGNKHVIAVSFHKRQRMIYYPFHKLEMNQEGSYV